MSPSCSGRWSPHTSFFQPFLRYGLLPLIDVRASGPLFCSFLSPGASSLPVPCAGSRRIDFIHQPPSPPVPSAPGLSWQDLVPERLLTLFVLKKRTKRKGQKLAMRLQSLFASTALLLSCLPAALGEGLADSLSILPSCAVCPPQTSSTFPMFSFFYDLRISLFLSHIECHICAGLAYNLGSPPRPCFFFLWA